MRPKAFSPVLLYLSFSFFLTAAELSFVQRASGQGLKAEITRVKIPRDRRPVVTFKIRDSKGKPLTIKDLDQRGIRFTMATIKVGKNGETSYHNYVLQKVKGNDYVYKGEKAVPRRTVVKTESCNVCHGTLALHGEQRRSVEYCVLCHNAAGTDKEKRVKAKGPMPPKNIHFKDMIKRLHTGEELDEPLVYYGGPPRRPGPIDFSHVKFPGDRKNCEKCHEKDTFQLPLPKGVLPTLVPQADGSTVAIAPITASCSGCHNKEPAMAHMETQTAAGRESCVVCHGTGRGFAVEKAHAR